MFKVLSLVINLNFVGVFKVYLVNENDIVMYILVIKRLRGVENYFDEVVILEFDGINLGIFYFMGEDDEDDEFCYSVCW